MPTGCLHSQTPPSYDMGRRDPYGRYSRKARLGNKNHKQKVQKIRDIRITLPICMPILQKKKNQEKKKFINYGLLHYLQDGRWKTAVHRTTNKRIIRNMSRFRSFSDHDGAKFLRYNEQKHLAGCKSPSILLLLAINKHVERTFLSVITTSIAVL